MRTSSAKSGALRTIKAGRRNARGQPCVVDAPNALVSGYLREPNPTWTVGPDCIISFEYDATPTHAYNNMATRRLSLRHSQR